MAHAFPIWLDAAHFANILFLSLLARSGLQVLAAFPRLYLNDGCTPGTEVAWFNRRGSPKVVATSLDEEVDAPAWLALPGGKSLGLGRHWHFAAMLGWILTGLLYASLLLATGNWHRIVPTSPAIVPQALAAAGDYLHLRLPPDLPGLPYNALQMLAYFGVVFLLAPFQIATGAAMSPAVLGAAPWYARLFGGRQKARTLHFAGLVAFAAFVVGHTVMVVVHGLPEGLAKIALADEEANRQAAVLVAAAGLAFVVLVHVAGTWLSRRRPRQARRLLGAPMDVLQRLLSRRLLSRQSYPPSAITPFHWVNGRPPDDSLYERHAQSHFAEWELVVDGLVGNPLRLRLDDLRALPSTSQVVMHNCIQGWSGIAEWTGVQIDRLLAEARPLAEARYLAVWSAQHPDSNGAYYECLDLDVALAPQSILAYEMNGSPLLVAHGAPLRLRVENQLGFKMVKWVERIELLSEISSLGQGQGGWREDHMHYSRLAAI